MSPPRIADTFQIHTRFMRSVNLERDFDDPAALRGYVVTPHAKAVLDRLLSGLAPRSGQRAWRITGDYGVGKSSLALALAHLLSREPESLPHQLQEAAGPGTRTLVGMARTTAATAWADTEQQRFVLGWFNRQALRGWNGVTSAVINSGTAIELDGSKRVEFLSWGDATVYAEAHAYSSNTGAGNTNWMTLGTLSGSPSVVEVAPAVSVSAGVPVSHASAALQGQFAAGYNAVLLKGYVSAGTATYVANAFVTVFG